MRIALIAAAVAAWPMLALAQDATSTATSPPPVATPSTAPPVSAAAAPSASTNAAPGAPTAAEPSAATTTAISAGDAQSAQRAQDFYNSLHRQTGLITIAGSKVTLNVPESYYFINAADARRVIVDVWRNPPSAAEDIDGMLFPAGANPYSDTWGAVVSYSGDGHVSDADAANYNYDDLLRHMQDATRQQNDYRHQHNYPGISLIGWAEPPHYDPHERKLYWAQALGDGGTTATTLNYDIRVLGRAGYLIISFVSDIKQLPDIKAAAPPIMAMASFTPGNTYADYREGVDQRAAYGIGGLIAGGAVAAIAQKTGLIALILAFGKKFIVLILAGLAAIGRGFTRFLGGGKSKQNPPDTPA